MHFRLLGAALAALFLTAPAQAQEPCLSRPSIQQKLLPQIVPLQEALTSVATGTDDTDEALRQLAEVRRLVMAWTSAPLGVYGCRAKPVK